MLSTVSRLGSRARFIALTCSLITATVVTTAVPGAVGASPGHEVSVSDVTVMEGDSGSGRSVRVKFTLSQPYPGPVAITWETRDGTATAGEDYRARSRTARVRAGRTESVANVPILADLDVEGDETFEVVVTGVNRADVSIGKGMGTVTILDDDPTSGPELAVGDVAVVEGDIGSLRAMVPLTLSQPLGSSIDVIWTTNDGTATAGEDYEPRTRMKRIRPGRTRVFLPVDVLFDTVPEADETFTIEVLSVSGAAVTTRRALGTVTILDDDTAPLPDGYELWSWGGNVQHQLGLGDTDLRTTPTQVGTDATWAGVTGGFRFGLGVRTDGTLWAWGNNSNGQLGLGDSGEATERPTPTQVGTDATWATISAGTTHTLAVRTDGTLWAWGNNSNGRTGLTTDVGNTLVPTQVGTDTGWAAVAAGGSHSLALRTDGTLWAWGGNDRGQLGLGDSGFGTERTTPTQVGTDADWATISAGSSHSLALRTDGTLWAWGTNLNGELGLGDDEHRSTPSQVGTDATWATISAGSVHSLATRTDGTAWGWGWNGDGRTGLGITTGVTLMPEQIGADTAWVEVAAGNAFGLGLRADGTLWAWGSNVDGSTGQDTTAGDTPTPAQIGTETAWVEVTAGATHSLGLRSP
jgi:alpha-tubulin suppressor-like RCC1 family protein